MEVSSLAGSPNPGSAAPPGAVRRAVIDIGTNSVKLLVADVSGQCVEPLLEQSEQTRLGRGFYETHRLQAAAIRHTAEAVTRFATAASTWQPAGIRVIATSAARDAVNADSLLNAVHETSGHSVEVISGTQEAEWVYRGVLTDGRLAGLPLLILDVGGGSTEFILGDGRQPVFCHSYPLGSVRLLEQLHHADPPTATECAHCLDLLGGFLDRKVRPALSPLVDSLRPQVQLVGTGGTTTILARIVHAMTGFDRGLIEATKLGRSQVRNLRERLWGLPLAERRSIPGLPSNRADVILAGVAIYEVVMDRFALDDLRVSTRGLRFAALLESS